MSELESFDWMTGGTDWSAVDWSLPDEENAARLGRAVGTVRKRRLEAGVLRCARGGRPGRPTVDWKEVDWSLPDEENAARLGRAVRTVGIMRREAGVLRSARGRPRWAGGVRTVRTDGRATALAVHVPVDHIADETGPKVYATPGRDYKGPYIILRPHAEGREGG